MYGSKRLAHQALWSLRRNLGLSPMQHVLKELKQRKLPLNEMDALEMFGGDGSRHTLDYYKLVRSLDVWEVNADMEPGLRRNLPAAGITIGNSFDQIKKTGKTYDLLVIDNSAGLFGKDKEYCEHFDAFTSELFRIVRSSAVIIVNIVPDLKRTTAASHSSVSPAQLRRRAAFYQTSHPEKISTDEIVPAYAAIAGKAGFTLDWHFTHCRTVRTQVHYLVMKLTGSKAKNPEQQTAQQIDKLFSMAVS